MFLPAEKSRSLRNLHYGETELGWMVHLRFLARFGLFPDEFEIEIPQIHLTVGKDVHSEEIFAFVEMEFDELRGEIPVVPLTPGDGIGRIRSGGDLKRAGCVFAVDVDCDGSATI